jgi:hypothetical protein
MNRRDLIKRSAQALVGVSGIALGVKAEQSEKPIDLVRQGGSELHLFLHSEPAQPFNECAHCGALFSSNETLAREIIAETGGWKRDLLRSRKRKDLPMVASRQGCCGCEIRLNDKHHEGEWTYHLRALTTHEKQAFQQEYGRSAALLLHQQMGDGFKVRGFILNGRKEGWNISVKRIGT